MDVWCKLAESMGAERDSIIGWKGHLRFNKYHFTEKSVGSVGLSTHTDAVFLTILQDDDSVGGLEVMLKSTSSFLPIDPLPGSLFVNLGDMATVKSLFFLQFHFPL